MASYELVTIVKGQGPQEAAPGKEAVGSLLKKHGATVKETAEWGHKKFWYPVDKVPSGTYTYYEIEMEPSKVVTLERDFRLNNQILRAMVTRKSQNTAVKKAAQKLGANNSA